MTELEIVLFIVLGIAVITNGVLYWICGQWEKLYDGLEKSNDYCTKKYKELLHQGKKDER